MNGNQMNDTFHKEYRVEYVTEGGCSTILFGSSDFLDFFLPGVGVLSAVKAGGLDDVIDVLHHVGAIYLAISPKFTICRPFCFCFSVW